MKVSMPSTPWVMHLLITGGLSTIGEDSSYSSDKELDLDFSDGLDIGRWYIGRDYYNITGIFFYEEDAPRHQPSNH